MSTSRSVPILILVLALGGAGDLSGQEVDETRLARWVEDLSDADYEIREEAFENLWRAGRPALPHVEGALGSGDLEIRERAERLIPLLRWSITPEIWRASGADVGKYDEATGEGKAEILRAVRTACGRDALPFFRAVLENEEDPAAWSVALSIGQDLAPERLLGWLEAQADRGTAGGPVYRYLGERYSRMAPAAMPVERLRRHAEAILGREEAFGDVAVYAAWTGTLLAAGLGELADRVFELGLAASSGDTVGYRLSGATRMLSLARVERAMEILEPVLEDTAWLPRVVEVLIQHRVAPRAWDVASRALAAHPDDEGLKASVFSVFQANLEFEYALAVAEAMADPGSVELVQLYRYTLDAEKGVAHRRRLLDAARRRDADRFVVWQAEWAALVEETLYYGLGAEALALVDEVGDALDEVPHHYVLAVRAASMAGEAERALALAAKVPADAERGVEFGRALLAARLATGTEGVVEACRLSGGEIGLLLRAYAATGDKEILEGRVAVRPSDSWAFDSTFGLGQIAERGGKPGEALYQYCRALAEIGSETNTRLCWQWDEVGRRSAYLGRVEGAVDEALAMAGKIGDPVLALRVRAEIERQTGDWAAAAADLDRMLAAFGEAAPDDEALDVAWAHVMAGGLERAEQILAPLREQGGDSTPGRIALCLSRMAAEAAGDADAVARFDETLYGRRIEKEIVYHSAFYLTSRTIDEAASREWRAILDVPEPGSNFPFFLSNAWEYQTVIAHRRGVEPGRSADFFLRGLQACWVNGYTIIEKGGEPRYRALIQYWKGIVARDEGRTAEAKTAFRRALGHDPYHVPSARALADLARADDPELAALADRLAVAELRRTTLAEPLDPEAHHQLALALEAAGDGPGAIAAARAAVGLSDDPRHAELLGRLEGGE